MNNDNDLNLHSMTKLSGWLRYILYVYSYTLYKLLDDDDFYSLQFILHGYIQITESP